MGIGAAILVRTIPIIVEELTLDGLVIVIIEKALSLSLLEGLCCVRLAILILLTVGLSLSLTT